MTCTNETPCYKPILRWVHSEKCREGTNPTALRDALAKAREEVERLTKEREAMHARFLDWRGVEEGDACQTCDGAGSRTYASTAVWRGGIGGQALTRAVCDKCWGSGSKSRPWLSHRQALAAFEAERAAEREVAKFQAMSEADIAERRAAERARDEAVAALAPFTDPNGSLRPDLPDDEEVSVMATVGDVRAARRVLAASTGEGSK